MAVICECGYPRHLHGDDGTGPCMVPSSECNGFYRMVRRTYKYQRFARIGSTLKGRITSDEQLRRPEHLRRHELLW